MTTLGVLLFYGGFVLFWTVAILILIGWNDDE